jgi:hypothetical protein
LGHYSNPALAAAGEQPPGRDRATPPRAVPHPTQRRLRAADVDSLVDGYRAGATIMELAGRFSISRTTVMAHLNRRNVKRRAATKEWDADALSRAARSYAGGSSLAYIGAEFGIDPQTVANRLRNAGIPIRPRRGSS